MRTGRSGVMLASILWAGVVAARAEPAKVVMGVYLRNVDTIDFERNNYNLDFDLWMRWREDLQPPPTETFRFMNVSDMWALSISPFYTDAEGKGAPLRLSDGSFYQRFQVQGSFYHKFWLGTYPLDWQKFTIDVEDRLRGRNELLWVPDEANSGIIEELEAPGWAVRDVENEERVMNPASDFGNIDRKPGADISRYRFGVRLYRPARFFFLRLLPPLLMVFFTSVMIFLLPVQYVDSRLAVVSTGILSEIFLQLTYTSDLPNISISTIVDMLYNLAYSLLIFAFAVCVWTGRLVDRQEQLQTAALDAEPDLAAELQLRLGQVQRRVVRLNNWAAAILSSCMLLGTLLIVIWMRGSKDLVW